MTSENSSVFVLSAVVVTALTYSSGQPCTNTDKQTTGVVAQFRNTELNSRTAVHARILHTLLFLGADASHRVSLHTLHIDSPQGGRSLATHNEQTVNPIDDNTPMPSRALEVQELQDIQ